ATATYQTSISATPVLESHVAIRQTSSGSSSHRVSTRLPPPCLRPPPQSTLAHAATSLAKTPRLPPRPIQSLPRPNSFPAGAPPKWPPDVAYAPASSSPSATPETP